MTLRTKVIGRNQTDHGPWVPGTVAGKKFHYQLFGCDWESLHDNNNTPPAVWDGGDIITPNTNNWKKVSGDYQAWLLKQNHPATTGTTGDYPYNGMGRVELAKNMVNTGTELAPVMVNQLTQDMFYKGAVGSRVPNTNTIFVIRYDYVLGEDITVPDNCVLEFEGGSISGTYTLTGVNTAIKADLVKVFDTTITLAGKWNVIEAYPEWFGAKGDDVTDDTEAFHALAAFVTAMDGGRIYIQDHTYKITEAIYMKGNIELYGCGRNSVLHLANSNTGIHIGDVDDFTLVNAYLTDGEGTIAGKTSGGGDVTCKCTVKGDTVVKVSDASKFDVNGIYVIQDLCDFSFDNSRCYYRQGEIIRVKAVDTANNTITLYNGLLGVYGNDNSFEGYVARPAADRDTFEQRFLTAIEGYAHRTVFFKYNFKKVNIHDLKVYAEGDNTSTVAGYYGLYVSNIINSKIENIEVVNEGGNHVAMRIDGAYQSSFTNSRVYSDFNSGSECYGFSLGDIQDFVVSDCTFGGRDHCIATGSKSDAGAIINRNFIYERINAEPISPSANGNTIVIDVHTGAELYTYRNIDIPSYGCDLGGYYMTVENCSFYNIETSFFGCGLSVRNCKAVSFNKLVDFSNPWHDYSNDIIEFDNVTLSGDLSFDFQSSGYPIKNLIIRNSQIGGGVDLRRCCFKNILIENCYLNNFYAPNIRYTGGTEFIIKGNHFNSNFSLTGNKVNIVLYLIGNYFNSTRTNISLFDIYDATISNNVILTTSNDNITITGVVSCLINSNKIKYGSRRWLYALCTEAEAADCTVNVAKDNIFIDTPYNATQTAYDAVINFMSDPW